MKSTASSNLMENSITIYSAALTLSCFLMIFSTSHGGGGDTLTQGQSLNDGNGQSLISAGDVFELGFFSPPNSTSRYVGIWYHGVSPQSVVWVANRASPVPSSAGILNFARDGNIAVLDDGGNALWSTNYNSTGLKNSSATLLDSGNLVINSSDSSVLWESFDHPTDTFLPGMQLVLNRKSGVNQLLTSWKSSGDPTAGNFTLGLDPRGSSQIFIWEAGEPRWRSGEWNRETFIGTMMRPLFIYGFNLVNDVDEGVMTLTFSQFNTSLFRFSLQWDGIENTTMLVEEGNDPYWGTVWQQPIHPCEIYGKCGAYGVCSDDGGSASCICMKGFEPKSSYEWNRGNWSGGCSRRTPLQCQLSQNETYGSGKEDGFFAVEGLKLPDSSDWGSTVGSEAGCRTACSTNCTCKAYAYVSGIGCMLWGRDLIDTYRFTEGGNDLNIKLAGSELDTKAQTWKIIVIFSTLGVAIVVLLLCIFLWWKCNGRLKEWWKKNAGKRLESMNFSSLRFSREANLDFSGPSEVGEKSAEQLPFYSFGSLATATNNFSESNKLGEGGFGKVYKGMLPGGQEVAVKRLSTNSGQGIQEFKNEMRLIANLQHRNLVRLVGCCIQEGEKILLYEYMLNKSLDAFIFDPTNQTLLDWNKRFNIIEGIARGLLYLHRDSRLRIVHRDLKASNVLLDQGMNPKISDFGMARIFGGDQNEGNTIRVVGTYGYMSPEYAMEGLFSVKSDVYSFGILVLEIVTGRRSNSFHRDKSFLNIVGYAWDFWQEDRAMELIDPSIRVSCSSQEVMRCVHVALLCLQDRADDRPEMSSVVRMLGSESAISPMPKQPKFTLVQSPKGRGNCNNFSTNDVTITELQAR